MNKIQIIRKLFFCFVGTFILSACASPPPQPPEVIGEYRPLNKLQTEPKKSDKGSYTVTAGKAKSEPVLSKESDWEILESDGTLKKTLERWSKTAGWEVIWEDVPEFKNPGHVSLPRRDFVSAVNYVLSKAKIQAKAAGIDISITAYPNKVLVISQVSKAVQK